MELEKYTINAYFNNNIISNVVTIILLIVIDLLKLNNVWGESFDRRSYHHLHNNDLDPRRTSWVVSIRNIIQKPTLERLKHLMYHPKKSSLQTKPKLLTMTIGGYYTPVPPLYKSDLKPKTLQVLTNIGKSFLPKLKKITGENLVLHNGNLSIFINRYVGNTAEFEWHYDRDSPECYKLLVFLHGAGDYSTFEYFNTKTKKIINVDLKPGDAILFNGKQTYHRVPKSNDVHSQRMTLFFQYKKQNSVIEEKKTFCNQLSDKSLDEIIIFVVKHTLITNIILMLARSNLSMAENIPDELYFKLAIITSVLVILCYVKSLASLRTISVFYIFTRIFYFLNHYESTMYLLYMIISDYIFFDLSQ